jgi:hypothetical protein
LPLGFGEVPYRPDQVMHLEGDISRLTSATGWTPRTTLCEGLARTIAWHRSQQNGIGTLRAPIDDMRRAFPDRPCRRTECADYIRSRHTECADPIVQPTANRFQFQGDRA